MQMFMGCESHGTLSYLYVQNLTAHIPIELGVSSISATTQGMAVLFRLIFGQFWKLH